MNNYYQIKRIAVATDFSEASQNAIDRAVELASIFYASVDIIHAVSPSASKNKKGEFVSSAYDRLKKKQQQVSGSFDGQSSVYARVGEVDDFVYAYCLKNSIDLLIIGLKPGNRKLFGPSKAYEIIMKVECPVLSIPAEWRHLQLGKILFPVRGVTGVKEKLLYSVPYMEKMNAILQMMIFGLPTVEQIREVTKVAAKEGVIFDPPDWDNLKEKDIPGQILQCAEMVDADLIVINATSEKEWYRVLGENYTEALLRESDLPLLSITHQFESAKL
jgi:nucleotide-binding universal stress UspA family protein